MNWITQHKLLFAIIVLILVGMVWYGLAQSGADTPLLTTETVGTVGTTGPDKGLVGTLLALRAVTLSGTIFSEPAFLSLQDFSTPIIPEPVGRSNPFAPINSQTGNSTSTGNAQIFTPAR
jgi:hypothetical protein